MIAKQLAYEEDKSKEPQNSHSWKLKVGYPTKYKMDQSGRCQQIDLKQISQQKVSYKTL